MKKIFTLGFVALALPLMALAQTLDPLEDFVIAVGDIVNKLVPLLIAIALVVFFWGLVRYVWRSGGGEGAKEGRDLMIWGLIALFVMVSVWGIIKLAQNALDIDSAESIPLPCVDTQEGVTGADGTCD